jgi:hypothetical protein
MTPSSRPEFTIRENPDGSLDVICLRCFLTAGTASAVLDLYHVERAHQCDPSLLIDLTNHCATC